MDFSKKLRMAISTHRVDSRSKIMLNSGSAGPKTYNEYKIPGKNSQENIQINYIQKLDPKLIFSSFWWLET